MGKPPKISRWEENRVSPLLALGAPICAEETPSRDESPGLPFHLGGTSGWRAVLLTSLLRSGPTPHSGTVPGLC